MKYIIIVVAVAFAILVILSFPYERKEKPQGIESKYFMEHGTKKRGIK